MNPFISKYQAKKLKQHEDKLNPQELRAAEPERRPVNALDEKKSSETTSSKRVAVRIVRCSSKSLDTDNLYGACKALIDQLRYSGLIPDDTEKSIDLHCSQELVRSRKEHKTLIEIDYK